MCFCEYECLANHGGWASKGLNAYNVIDEIGMQRWAGQVSNIRWSNEVVGVCNARQCGKVETS